MKYYIIIFIVFEAVARCFGQCPYNDNTATYKNDLNWQVSWGDSFNYVGIPDPARWTMNRYGGAGYYPNVIQTNDGHNASVNDSFLSLTAKRGSYALHLDSTHAGIDYPYTIRRPFTSGRVNTIKGDFKYGYIEAKIRLPENYYTAKYGGDWDNGVWLYNSAGNVNWNELDYEIISWGIGPGPNVNNMEINTHVEEPANMKDVFWALHLSDSTLYPDPSNGGDPSYDPSHFDNKKTDPSSGWANYFNYYQNYRPIFNHGWHIFAWEWLPDQIKFYVDNKLYWRLEHNYVFNYTDVYGHAHSMHPIDSLILGMPIYMNIDPSGGGADTTQPGPDSLSMDIKYVKYYTLKKAACGTPGFVETGLVPYEMCGNYVQQVYSSVVLGDSTGTCPTCSVTVNAGCRESVRAKTIKLFDGFKVGEGEFYADDVDNCKLP